MKKVTIFIVFLFSFFLFSQPTFANSTNQLIIINKATNQLAYYTNGKHVDTYKVATGRQSNFTPEGIFKVVNKLKNRPYYKANIAGGDRRNPLGDRWIGINARGTNGTTYAIHGNNNSKSIGTYASAGCIRMFNDEIRLLFEQVEVNTPVVITNTKQSFDAIAATHGYNVESKLSHVTVSTKSPQPTNTSVAFTAMTSSGQDPLFKYSLYDGSKWTTLQDFSSSKSLNWEPTKAGSYKVKVQVKSKKSNQTFDDEKVISYNIFTPASLNSVKADEVSPQPTNTSIVISANSNSNPDNLFKFLVYNGETWTTIQPFSSTPIANWKPSTAGSYKLKVQTKHKDSKNNFDSEKTINYLVYDSAEVTSFSSDKVSPSPDNSTINLTAKSNKDSNNVFKFLVHDGSKWTTINDFSSTSKVNWKPLKEGSYKLKVQVKHKFSKKSFDQEKEMNYVVYKKATLDSVQTDKVSPQFAKAHIIVSANTVNKNHLYKFYIHDGTDWKTVQDYSHTTTYNWDPQHEGPFKIKVEVKHKLSKEKYDDVKEINYYINKPVTLQELTPTIREHEENLPLTISAIATGGTELQFKFELLQNSNWVTLQDYSPYNTFERVTPTESGNNTIRVLVKEQGSTNEFDAVLEERVQKGTL
ncbi:triple tyrosine motif-containing protein [Alkalihalobacillus deserti]|uniref:triple tyrosine motif-containing protein n=1 Tax=Alkalihalobacillus deserti TaxID=2879466 RepID=UPI001D14E520|nr:triple tyrosine motif-containing protein [Alkalihalobacillus deserti]